MPEYDEETRLTSPAGDARDVGGGHPTYVASTGATNARQRSDQIERLRRAAFGGVNAGADFFGWLVAVAMTVLLAGIVGAVAAAVGHQLNVTQAKIEKDAGTFGVATAIGLLVILMIAYYAGGYVAGRMSRYDGGRQGVGVWLYGVVITSLAVAVGAIFGSTYNVFDRVDLPSIPIPTDTATWGGIITLVAILVGTLLTAVAGGKVGQRYHRKVDGAP